MLELLLACMAMIIIVFLGYVGFIATLEVLKQSRVSGVTEYSRPLPAMTRMMEMVVDKPKSVIRQQIESLARRINRDR